MTCIPFAEIHSFYRFHESYSSQNIKMFSEYKRIANYLRLLTEACSSPARISSQSAKFVFSFLLISKKVSQINKKIDENSPITFLTKCTCVPVANDAILPTSIRTRAKSLVTKGTLRTAYEWSRDSDVCRDQARLAIHVAFPLSATPVVTYV